MIQFKTASRTGEEMKLAQAKVAEAFNQVKGTDGKLNKLGVRQLKEMEWELGELIIQLMDDTVATTDPTAFLVDVMSGDIANEYVWQEVSAALRIVDRANGSKPNSQRLTFSEYQIHTAGKELVVEVPLEQVASGRYNPALIAEVMAEAVTRWRIGFVLAGLDAGVPSAVDRSGASGFSLRYTGMTEGNLKNAVNGLLDESETPAIFGRHVALAAIQGFAGWATSGSDAALREFETRGMVGQYLGAPIISLRDRFSKRTNSHVIPANRAYLSSGTKGAILMEKDVSFLNFSEVLPAESVYRVGIRMDLGLLVYDPYQYRIITVTP